jgi:hypothetical protein
MYSMSLFQAPLRPRCLGRLLGINPSSTQFVVTCRIAASTSEYGLPPAPYGIP